MEKVYNIRTWSCALVIIVVHFAIAAMAETSSMDTLVQDLIAISRDSDDMEVRRQAIVARPSSEIRNALEEMLDDSGSQAIALRAIDVLRLEGFEKKLRELVKATTSPEVILAVNKFDRDAKTVEVYGSRLQTLAGKTKNSAVKIGLLAGLAEFNEIVALETFKKLLKDENERVCEATLLHLAATAKKLKAADVATRFKIAGRSPRAVIRQMAQTMQADMAKSTP